MLARRRLFLSLPLIWVLSAWAFTHTPAHTAGGAADTHPGAIQREASEGWRDVRWPHDRSAVTAASLVIVGVRLGVTQVEGLVRLAVEGGQSRRWVEWFVQQRT